ncbi:uncharacterized protein PGTG_00277 [Puccinia graminis f. sp. tritici CRL 75-36-700-3]|uniref:Uncharacterized protein n=1 Tax=Puccinia graminis f. sp. tritici (strain CRL 75-36-700-3 / race SCCL) TaxID=418459 RepID=E3JQY8_PUCGT|nr:uncharacterized protein PGTG_00277 [Puccinia graminis f. sp. tritici CRL 75-36-700-3]EFP74321.1 hypothetical protein PGTG_00277 [Puccinia graminis f. sp. tritici CRL 75-36-700-3]
MSVFPPKLGGYPGIPGAKGGNTAGRNPSRRGGTQSSSPGGIPPDELVYIPARREKPLPATSIGTYFGTLGHVFDKTNTTAAAISAIVVTNFILIGYIFAALSEPDDKKNNDTITDLQKKKKKDS